MQILSFQADIAERMLKVRKASRSTKTHNLSVRTTAIGLRGMKAWRHCLRPIRRRAFPVFGWKGRKALKSCVRWWNAASLTKWKSLTAMTTRGSKRLKIADTTATLAPADIKGMAGLPQGVQGFAVF